MVKTNKLRDLEQQDRLSYRDNAHTLVRIIEDGTNCSYFESQIIAEKAQEVFQIGAHNTDHSLQPGQIIWKAISASDKPGKPLESCTFKRIHLTLHNFDEDQEVQQTFNASIKRQQQINRMCQESFEQEALLTQEDLAYLLNCDVRTIRRDIRKYQKEKGILIPTRGTKMDIGPGITHKDKAVELFIQGKDAVSIARDLNHSLKAIERYIQTFCRVVYCMHELQNTLKTAMVLGISVKLVNRHLDLRNKHKNKPYYKERIEEIEQVGNCFWNAQDSKKKNGQITRGIK